MNNKLPAEMSEKIKKLYAEWFEITQNTDDYDFFDDWIDSITEVEPEKGCDSCRYLEEYCKICRADDCRFNNYFMWQPKDEPREWIADIKLQGKLGTENEYKTLAHTKLENLTESEAKLLLDFTKQQDKKEEPTPKLPEKFGKEKYATQCEYEMEIEAKVNDIIDCIGYLMKELEGR